MEFVLARVLALRQPYVSVPFVLLTLVSTNYQRDKQFRRQAPRATGISVALLQLHDTRRRLHPPVNFFPAAFLCRHSKVQRRAKKRMMRVMVLRKVKVQQAFLTSGWNGAMIFENPQG